MARGRYYDIPEEAFLFGMEPSPEESVRQWVIYELLSSYGYLIKGIEVETKVKVGTRNHRADIVVKNHNGPYIVIECKRKEFKNHEVAMKQAQSYATATDIGADFAVYTNGSVWRVRKRFGSEWLSVSDIPINRGYNENTISFERALYSLDDARPLLRWLFAEIPFEAVPKYLESMQILFHAPKELTDGTSDMLRMGIDLLLRSICSRIDKNVSDYRLGKLKAAYNDFQTYFRELGIDTEDDSEWNEKEYILILMDQFERLVRASSQIVGLDSRAERLALSLLQYTLDQTKNRENGKQLPLSINTEFCRYIDLALTLNFNIALPDPLDEEAVNRIRLSCESDWEGITV